MSFLTELLKKIKSVSELDEGEDRDVVLNAVDVISYKGKVDSYEKFNKELYEILNKELRKDIEKQGIKQIKTEVNYSNYKFEINKLRINLNTVREKIEELEGKTYVLTYSYEQYGEDKAIKDMVICVK